MTASVVILTAGTEPATPSTGQGAVYVDSTDGPSFKDHTGKISRLDSGILTVTRHLTSAEILALSSNPVTLVAGVPGGLYEPVYASLIFHAGTVTYVAGGGIGLGWGSVTNLSPIQFTDMVWTDTVDGFAAPLPNGLNDIRFVDFAVLGADLVIFAAGGDPTNGNGTMELVVLYRVRTVFHIESIAFGVQPTPAAANAVISPHPTVRVLDQNGDPYLLAPLVVTVALTIPGAATLAGTLPQNSDIATGLATFDDLAVDVADTYTLTATVTSPFDGSTLTAESDPFVIS